jgi:hypothetical protein
MSIERLLYLRRLLAQGTKPTAAEINSLLDEVEYLHKSREALMYTLNTLRETTHDNDAHLPPVD